MANGDPAREGYIRASEELRLLDSSANSSSDPMYGYLDLFTDDGRLRLKITKDGARDLLVDLEQFLKSKYL